jgi:hypothetical protein
MTVARAVGSATRLADGRVLVAGGCTDPGCDLGSQGGDTAELFDPATGSFQATGPLTEFRDDHSAVRLADGRVILIGGWGTSGVLASTDIFEPRTGTFSPGPRLRSGRSGVVPVVLVDGRILIAGGFVGNRPTIAAAELLDPRATRGTPTGSLTTPRGAYAAALLADGRVLIAGGLSDGGVVASAEIYDPATGRFTATGSMATARYKGGALTLPDGDVLVIGGAADIEGQVTYASTERYHPATETFSPGPTMNLPRYKLGDSTIRLESGDVLVAGGARQPELYRVATDQFVPVGGSLDATRLFLAAAALDGDRALLVGGYDRAIRPTASAWLFDLSGR